MLKYMIAFMHDSLLIGHRAVEINTVNSRPTVTKYHPPPKVPVLFVTASTLTRASSQTSKKNAFSISSEKSSPKNANSSIAACRLGF